ncbi:MAG: DUF2267 domain-containing protein [Desulfobulbaceae bacterium]|nr:DUF2267 domain-containing protein [Desulfobulbaceae bacterium]
MMQFLDKSVPEANKWVTDFMNELQISETSLARRLLRSTLHALRDCLPWPDAEKFGAQLPLVMRENFFQGWRPGRDRLTCGSRQELSRRLRRYINCQAPIEEERALRAFSRVLDQRIPQHDIENISAILPDGLAVRSEK